MKTQASLPSTIKVTQSSFGLTPKPFRSEQSLYWRKWKEKFVESDKICISAQCNHRFHEKCFLDYIHMKIWGGMFPQPHCPVNKCNRKVALNVARGILTLEQWLELDIGLHLYSYETRGRNNKAFWWEKWSSISWQLPLSNQAWEIWNGIVYRIKYMISAQKYNYTDEASLKLREMYAAMRKTLEYKFKRCKVCKLLYIKSSIQSKICKCSSLIKDDDVP